MKKDSQSIKSKIAKNSLALYFRSILSMGITLYTSRVVLQILGIVDFGIYNVIAGMVGVFSVFSGTIANAVSRFFAFALGRKDGEEVTRIYTVSNNILLLSLVLILIIGETLGVYFLNVKLNIPSSRLDAANWVFQAVMFSFAVNTMNTPNNAAIVAYEKMTFFAYMGIFDALTKLLIVFVLKFSVVDNLKLYAALLCVQQALMFLCYFAYVKSNFKDCVYKLKVYVQTFKSLFSYIGWTFLASIAFVTKNQGVDMVLNVFFGPVVNAAKGIAGQVQNATSTFGVNFLSAIAPQITKSFAAGDNRFVEELICRGMKFTFFLLLILMLPIGLNINYILHLWLVNVPPMTSMFVILILLLCVCDTCSLPFHHGIMASGKIKIYQILSAIIQWANLPFSYLILVLGAKPYAVLGVGVFFSLSLFLLRILYTRKLVGLSLRRLARFICIKMLPVAVISIAFNCLSHGNVQNIWNLVLSVLVITISNLILIYMLGLNASERIMIQSKIKSYGNKFFKFNQ